MKTVKLIVLGLLSMAVFNYCKSDEIVIGECNYGIKFTSAVKFGNIYGTQFHPEKSQYYGLEVLKNFIEKA